MANLKSERQFLHAYSKEKSYPLRMDGGTDRP